MNLPNNGVVPRGNTNRAMDPLITRPHSFPTGNLAGRGMENQGMANLSSAIRQQWQGQPNHLLQAGPVGIQPSVQGVPLTYWWQGATVGSLNGWMVNGWASPDYYSYGPGGSVSYRDNVVYVNDQRYATASEYYNQALGIAENAPPLAELAQQEWLPLGVFALTRGDGRESNMLLQLALSKKGIIVGTLDDELTKGLWPVTGSVDRTTQRAAWAFTDGYGTKEVMETGIFNLTQDTAEALVHHGSDTTQKIMLVRLDEPTNDYPGQ